MDSAWGNHPARLFHCRIVPASMGVESRGEAFLAASTEFPPEIRYATATATRSSAEYGDLTSVSSLRWLSVSSGTASDVFTAG
jgi:hypothetical protein